jgi:hypothetical protein
MKTPWGRAAIFYWAFLWRGLLLFAVFSVPFLMLYWIIKLLLDQWPLVERLVRLSIILSMMALGFGFALQWAMTARFSHLMLRIVPRGTTDNETLVASEIRLTLSRALSVLWSSTWRYTLVVVPVNYVLLRLFLGGMPTQPNDWRALLEAQAISIPSSFLIGIWAIREALSLSYRNFQFEWQTPPIDAEPITAATPP